MIQSIMKCNMKKIKKTVYQFTYNAMSPLASISGKNSYIKRKHILLGIAIIGLIGTISSCKTKQPHKCYAPVIDKDFEIQDTTKTK